MPERSLIQRRIFHKQLQKGSNRQNRSRLINPAQQIIYLTERTDQAQNQYIYTCCQLQKTSLREEIPKAESSYNIEEREKKNRNKREWEIVLCKRKREKKKYREIVKEIRLPCWYSCDLEACQNGVNFIINSEDRSHPSEEQLNEDVTQFFGRTSKIFLVFSLLFFSFLCYLWFSGYWVYFAGFECRVKVGCLVKDWGLLFFGIVGSGILVW